jgi:hypothetical protein
VVVWIIALVDDEFSNIVQFAISLLINVSCINSPHTWFVAGQFFVGCIKSPIYSPIDAVSCGEHPVLVQNGAAAAVEAKPPQGHHGGVLSLGCVGAVYNALLADRLLKTLR